MNVPETEEEMDDDEIVLQDDRRGINPFIIEKMLFGDQSCQITGSRD